MTGYASNMKCKMLLGSGASTNFASEKFVNENQIRNMKRNKNLDARFAGGQIEASAREVKNASLNIQGLIDKENSNALKLRRCDAMLGASWLEKVDAATNRRKRCATTRSQDAGCETLHPDDNCQSQSPNSGRDDCQHIDMKNCDASIASALQMKRLLRKGNQNAGLMMIRPARDEKNDDMRHCALSSVEAGDAEEPSFRKRVAELVERCKDVFPEDLPAKLPPSREADHEIRLKPKTETPPRGLCKISCHELGILKEKLEELINKGYARPSKSPCGSPAIIARSGGKCRLCIDCRALNQCAIKNKHPLPRIDEMFDRLAKAKLYSRIDLASGFYQIRMQNCNAWSYR